MGRAPWLDEKSSRREVPPGMSPGGTSGIASLPFGPPRTTSRLRLLALNLGSQPGVPLLELGSIGLADIRRLEDRANLDLALAQHRVRAAPRPLDRLVHRRDLPDPVAGDQLLRLRERPIDNCAVLAGEAHPLPRRRGFEPLSALH